MTLDREALHGFISELELPEEEKRRLLDLAPATYPGYAAELARSLEA